MSDEQTVVNTNRADSLKRLGGGAVSGFPVIWDY